MLRLIRAYRTYRTCLDLLGIEHASTLKAKETLLNTYQDFKFDRTKEIKL